MGALTVLTILSIGLAVGHAASRGRLPLWPAVLVLGLIHLIQIYGT